MPIPAFIRLPRTRLGFAGGAVITATVALTCAIAPGTAQAATPSTYTVKSGDSLAKIARTEHVPGGWQAIAAVNHIARPYVLQPGERLTLPAGSASTHSRVAGASVTRSAARAGKYANNLDGWIRHSLAIMKQHGIPGSYNGIHRNVIRESSGNPNAINLWDSNAAAGTPSIGLLQVIQPTFKAYHVAGTSWDIHDPVANITAGCNYAAHRYGSIDNVNSAY